MPAKQSRVEDIPLTITSPPQDKQPKFPLPKHVMQGKNEEKKKADIILKLLKFMIALYNMK